MTDMFTGMPFYWQGPGPMGPVTGPDPFSAKISAQQANQQQQLAQWNATAAAAAAPTPPGYGQVHLPYLSGSFGPAAAAGTYSPGSGRSSFSGTSLGNPSGSVTRGPDLAAPPWQNPFATPQPQAKSVFDTGTTPFNNYMGGANPGGFSPSPNYVGGTARSVFNTGTTPFNNYMGGANPGGFSPSPNYAGGRSVFDVGTSPIKDFGGGANPGGFSPSPNYTGGTVAHGGPEDTKWMLEGSQGPRPSDVQSAPKSPLTGLGFGGNRDALASLMMRNASPQAPAFPVGQGIGKADRLPLFQGGVKAFGGQEDQDWVTGGSQGARPSSGLTYGGSEDQAWVQGGSQGDRPSTSQGIGSDMLRGNQNQPYAQPWHSMIPSGTPNTPEIIKQINYTAGRNRQDPAALAGVVNTESRWDPTRNFNSYFGATQMGPKTFKEAGGTLDGMNFNQYKAAPLERQIPAYGDWLAHYARPGNAAGLATSDIRSYPVPMQAAIMQGAQFAPNATSWPAAFARGDTSMQTTPSRQADFLSPLTQGWKPTLNTMNDYYGRTIPR